MAVPKDPVLLALCLIAATQTYRPEEHHTEDILHKARKMYGWVISEVWRENAAPDEHY